MRKHRVYCGPTVVETAAERLTSAGLDVVVRGTEHVYVNAPNPETVLAALNTPHYGGWTWRDVYQFEAR